MQIFFSVGEPSGDVHGANLIRELKQRAPQIECVGYGGPRMQAAGCELHADLTKFAIMWFLRVLLNIHHFWRLYRRADNYFRQHHPDAVVLIDYPGFNWWIARAAKRHRVPVFYYGVPQIWAWGRWRIKKMRRLIDHVLCKLPFEESWYRQQGCHATYIGHPFFDETTSHQFDTDFLREQSRRPGRLVAILPGSRTQEVKSNLSWFLAAADIIHRQLPDTRFAIAAFDEKRAAAAREILASHGCQAPIDTFVEKTPELMHLAGCCMACSGSVSLELLYHEKPTVILYWINRFAYFLQRFFVKVQYITLVNLLATDDLFPEHVAPFDPDAPGAEAVPFPEYLTWEDKSQQVAAHIVEWLSDEAAFQSRVAMLRDLKARVAQPGASCRAAEYILATLRGAPNMPPPHFQAAPSATPAADDACRHRNRT